MGTWDVLFLYRSGVLRNLMEIIKECGIDLLTVQEVRWLGKGILDKTVHKPEGTRRVGGPVFRLLESVEDLKMLGVRNWRRKSQDRVQWTAIVKVTKVHHGL
jgi:hypothetical protein